MTELKTIKNLKRQMKNVIDSNLDTVFVKDIKQELGIKWIKFIMESYPLISTDIPRRIGFHNGIFGYIGNGLIEPSKKDEGVAYVALLMYLFDITKKDLKN